MFSGVTYTVGTIEEAILSFGTPFSSSNLAVTLGLIVFFIKLISPLGPSFACYDSIELRFILMEFECCGEEGHYSSCRFPLCLKGTFGEMIAAWLL